MTKNKGGGQNKIAIDEDELLRLYATDKSAVARLAKRYGISSKPIYSRLKKLGVTRSNSEAHVGVQAGPRNPNWKGGKTTHSGGYIRVSAGKGKSRQVFEHRLVAEQMLGRPLTDSEVVHHKNGIRSDNRPENIEVLPSQSEHMRRHFTSDVARERGARGNQKRLAAHQAKKKSE